MKPIIFIWTLSIIILNIGCKDTNKNEPTLAANPAETNPFTNTKIIDLSHSYSNETIYWVTAKEFETEKVAYGVTDKGFFYAANNFTTAEHGGTHIDAPIHFAEHGQTVDEIPLEHLIGSAVKVDVSKKASDNTDYLISVEDLLDWEKQEGQTIPDGSIVLLYTGFEKYYPNKLKYMGTDKRGSEAVAELHFPGLAPEAAKWLVSERNIHAVGLDTPSIDYGQSTEFKSHVNLMTKNVPAFENLTNLDQLPSKGFQVVALPMKIKGGSGSPLRIIAIVNQ
ncbi:cyclase family protein [Mangrovimonas aestuarii]|uniref:cyclase family protein n=1 Tax=Mangrovimonas aestuarii TaxID=3018443 RepID=UPI00237902C3|nr:cyclase family protein [Mangrovimonas aestuarii]